MRKAYHGGEKEWEGADKDLENIHVAVGSAPYLELRDVTWPLGIFNTRWRSNIRDGAVSVHALFLGGGRPFVTIVESLGFSILITTLIRGLQNVW